MEHLMSTVEAAQLLGISDSAVRRLISRGRLAAVWAAGRWLVDRRVVRGLLSDPRYLRQSRRVTALFGQGVQL